MAEAGLGSRRKVEELITAGKVKVNNKITTNLATTVDPQKDKVSVNNQPLVSEKKVYIMLNKPRGFVTTVSDELGRPTVLDLVDVEQRIFPVGRLDKNSRGLIILTNDGDFANILLHPKHKVEKVYIVIVNKELTSQQLQQFSEGLVIDKRKTAPAEIKLIGTSRTARPEWHYEVVLREGRKRQIRLMFEELGNKVLDLKRVQLGSLNLGNLKAGKWRNINSDEIKRLIAAFSKS